MWLTSWWVAWLLNFYGFSHTNCMVFYRTPLTRYGISWNSIGTSGNPMMAFHGTLRYSLEFPWTSKETPWNFMAFHGTPSILHGTPWHSMEPHGYSMELHGIRWNSMDTPVHGSSMEFHGFPSISMDFHGIPFHGGISHGILLTNSPGWDFMSEIGLACAGSNEASRQIK